jgi:hypothetical protein
MVYRERAQSRYAGLNEYSEDFLANAWRTLNLPCMLTKRGG